MKNNVIVVGYPKSGNTWVTRLVAELLQCPVNGFWGKTDHGEIAVEGNDRCSKFSCFKGHHTYDELVNTADFLGSQLIYVIRDPRDVAISASHYFFGKLEASRSWRDITLRDSFASRIDRTISAVICGDAELHYWLRLSWRDHVETYLSNGVFYLRYEDLLTKPFAECNKILDYIGLSRSEDFIHAAIERQSFDAAKTRFLKTGDQGRYAFMRSGRSGQWKGILSPKQLERFNLAVGDTLRDLGYELPATGMRGTRSDTEESGHTGLAKGVGLRNVRTNLLGLFSPSAWRSRTFQMTFGRFRTVDEFLAAASEVGQELILVTSRGSLKKRDIVLFATVKNEAKRLPSFLAHYRRLGVNRFIIVDNGSDDGTAQILSSSPDVDLWLAPGAYSTGRSLWLSALIQAFARDRWAVVADADEFLVYEGMNDHDLHSLTRWMERSGRLRLRAYLVDVYGDKPIRDTVWPPGLDPLQANWFFDPLSYSVHGNLVRGGPRSRVFSTKDAQFGHSIRKSPIVKFDAASALTHIHFPYPYHLNEGDPYAALLHLKFTSDFVALVERAVAEGQYWQNSREYRVYQRALRENPDLSLYDAFSQPYEGPGSLVQAGLMKPIPWNRTARFARRRYSRQHRVHATVRSLIGPSFSDLRRN